MSTYKVSCGQKINSTSTRCCIPGWILLAWCVILSKLWHITSRAWDNLKKKIYFILEEKVKILHFHKDKCWYNNLQFYIIVWLYNNVNPIHTFAFYCLTVYSHNLSSVSLVKLHYFQFAFLEKYTKNKRNQLKIKEEKDHSKYKFCFLSQSSKFPSMVIKSLNMWSH